MKTRFSILVLLPILTLLAWGSLRVREIREILEVSQWTIENNRIMQTGFALQLAIEKAETEWLEDHYSLELLDKGNHSKEPKYETTLSQIDKLSERYISTIQASRLAKSDKQGESISAVALSIQNSIKLLHQPQTSLLQFHSITNLIHDSFASIVNGAASNGIGRIFLSLTLLAKSNQDLLLICPHLIDRYLCLRGTALEKDHSVMEHLPSIQLIKSKFLILHQDSRNEINSFFSNQSWQLLNKAITDVISSEHSRTQALANQTDKTSLMLALLSIFELREKVTHVIENEISLNTTHVQTIDHEILLANIARIMIALLICAGTMLLSFLTARSLVRDILQIEAFATEIGQGNLDVTYKICRNDELGRVGKTLNGMVEELKKSKLQVQTQQVTLVTQSKFSALGEMAGGIAHEINTPLGSISINSEGISEIVRSENPNLREISGMADDITLMVRRIADIIRSLRTFSHHSDQLPHKLVPVQIIINDTISLCRERFKNHRIDLRIKQDSPDLRLYCNSIQISQVLLNLLNNAFDAVEQQSAAPNTGDLGTERWVELRVSTPNTQAPKNIEISVTDSGHGISAAVQEKMFQPFFTTKPIGRGTGIGLSVSHGIAKQHGGQLTYDPDSKNTRFVLIIPMTIPMTIGP